MSRDKKTDDFAKIGTILAGLMNAPAGSASPGKASSSSAEGNAVTVGARKFVIEHLSSSDLAAVTRGIERLAGRKVGAKGVPLLVVPFMGEVGARRCAEAGVSWLDLSGNAQIVAPGLRIHVEGKQNKFKRRGRPSSLFAPKSSRIVRWLLMNETARRTLTQRDLARLTGMDAGFTSRILCGLEESGLISRDAASGTIRVVDHDLLLDAWHEAYDFRAHTIVRAHMAARSGPELMEALAHGLDDRHIDYAMTGLGAAWLLSRFATFRIVTVYLRQAPSDETLADLGVQRMEKGENLWLVLPNDEGVFQNAGRGQDTICVDPVQIYLDLKGHPERAKEAAAQLRFQTRIARELRAGDAPKEIATRYREHGVTEENVDFIRKMITNGVSYFPPLKGRDE